MITEEIYTLCWLDRCGWSKNLVMQTLFMQNILTENSQENSLNQNCKYLHIDLMWMVKFLKEVSMAASTFYLL